MRLIDADFLRGLVNAKLEEDWGFLPKKFLFGVRDLLDSTPTIDAVEVVRCENCDYWNRSNECFSYGMCTKVWMNRDATFYCKSGERKTDA